MATTLPSKTYTNLGSLPSGISFPASCTDTVYDMKHTYFGLPQFQPTAGCALKECCPSGKYYTDDWAWYFSYFSPAVCPRGYSTCLGPTASFIMSSSVFILSTALGETVAFCCPSDYECPMQSPFYGACGSRVAVSTTTSIFVMDDINHQSRLSWRSYDSAESGYQGWVVAYPIQVRMGGPSTSSLESSGVHTSATSTHSGAAETGTKLGSLNTSDKLSTGAIIGIALGGFIGVALLLLGCLWLLRRRRRVPVSVPDPASYPYPTEINKFSVQETHLAADGEINEMPSSPHLVSELPASPITSADVESSKP
ncbi:hypothetical protein BCR34DRAFT_607747 [Clohesyomyces aquaticus]|uniref:Uncharacterized protein n=1 Tax=Clohesyomyces aquaticus TaxID=1231657 RepID=A0A1Y1YDJ7_9PLEO|nr:hypothetical protein BCR34DRAFT_607747 [Clohesyomyces aquaticus]